MNKMLMRAQQLATSQVQRVQLQMLPDVLEGAGCLYDVGDVLKEHDVRCAMVVTTQGFVKRGTLGQFLNNLLAHGIATAVFSEVVPDPDFECVEKAAAFFRSRNCDGIIAIGGGSVMDCAKIAGALVARPGKSARDLIGTMKVRKETPFLVAIPTTAGTGSEVTAAAVVTDAESQRKYAISDLMLIPNVAVLDATLLTSLPPALTAYTGMDALTHAVEAYINRFGAAEARDYAREAVELIFEHLKPSYDDGKNTDHREAMLTASYWAGIAFTNAFVGYVHALAHGIGGRYHVQHGLANAVLLPVVLEEYGETVERQLADLAVAIGLDGANDHELAVGFIAAIRRLSASMGIPETIPEIRLEDVPELAAGAEEEGNPAYPVPQIWHYATFQKVLRRVMAPAQVGGDAEDASGAETETQLDDAPSPTESASGKTGQFQVERAGADTQLRITQAGPLLDDAGRLTTLGYATSLLLDYDRKRIKATPLRIKEWDYYLVNDSEYALALTIGDMGYAALVSASLIDFADASFTTQSTMDLLPLGRLGLPRSSSTGTSSYADKRVKMRFDVAGGMRQLSVSFDDFKDGQTLVAEVVLDREPRDSMVIATPWAESSTAFYYNQKIIGMRAIGTFELGDLRHAFHEEEALGLLDWGRGVWTRDNTWFWSAAQGRQDGRLVGFNLGYGFGDTSAATENMLFVDGIAHKLGHIDFGIPERDHAGKARTVAERFDLLRPWHMTDDEGRLDLVFTPSVDRCDFMDFKVVKSDQHQVFGRFDGTVVLDDGSTLDLRGLQGFAEAVHNKY